MAKLTEKDVEHVARLAKLNLSQKQLEKFQKQLTQVVSYVSELDEVDTSGVHPTSQTTGLENSTREDITDTSETLSQEDAVSGTQKAHNGYFVVPMILTQRTDY